MRQKDDPHGPNIAVYVGNLPTGLSQRQYEKILLDIVGPGKVFCVWRHTLLVENCLVQIKNKLIDSKYCKDTNSVTNLYS